MNRIRPAHNRHSETPQSSGWIGGHHGPDNSSVCWWGEGGIPAIGSSVLVLHEDGKWYPGKLSECDGGNRWHVVFDDGDSDWYTLPHR